MRERESLLSYSVFIIVFINIAVFILQMFAFPLVDNLFALKPRDVLHFKVWQLLTYSFLHDPGFVLDHNFRHLFHLLLNMMALVMFGLPVEAEWGKKRFIKYYLLCAGGAGVFIFLISLISGNPSPTIGASGAVLGIVFAFAKMHPDAEVYLLFFPMKARTLIIVIVAMSIIFQFSGTMSYVSHIGHLGGILAGFLYFTYKKWIFSRGRKSFVRIENSDTGKIIEEQSRADHNLTLKKSIVEKLENGGGKDSLDDEEWQLVRYLDIMYGHHMGKTTEDSEELSDEEFIRIVKQHIEI